MFKIFDEDQTEKISFANLKRIAKENKVVIDEDELQSIVDDADTNGDGAISFDEFKDNLIKDFDQFTN